VRELKDCSSKIVTNKTNANAIQVITGEKLHSNKIPIAKGMNKRRKGASFHNGIDRNPCIT